MSLLARFEQVVEEGERRASDRHALRLAITARVPEAPELAATIHDLSEAGILLETLAPLDLGQGFELNLPLVGPVETVVVWNSGHFYGCRFDEAVPRSAVSAALLQSVPKNGEPATASPPQDLVSQLRDLNSQIEHVGQQLDRTIDDLSAGRPRGRPGDPEADVAAALPRSPIALPPDIETPIKEPARYSDPLPFKEIDPSRWVVIVSLVLAGLAVIMFIAALLQLPIAPWES